MPAATRRRSTTQPMQQRAASKKKGSGQKPCKAFALKKKGVPSSTLPIFKQLVSEYGEKVLVYTYHSKKFKCEWQDEDLPVLAISSETTPSSKLPGHSFETPLDWVIDIHHEENGPIVDKKTGKLVKDKKISPKSRLFYMGCSLFQWEKVVNIFTYTYINILMHICIDIYTYVHVLTTFSHWKSEQPM